MEQNEKPKFTQEEVVDNLKKAIEIQTLQTDLQELRSRMIEARAKEIHFSIQIEGMMSEPEDNKEPTQEEKEFKEEIEKSRKLKK